MATVSPLTIAYKQNSRSCCSLDSSVSCIALLGQGDHHINRLHWYRNLGQPNMLVLSTFTYLALHNARWGQHDQI